MPLRVSRLLITAAGTLAPLSSAYAGALQDGLGFARGVGSRGGLPNVYITYILSSIVLFLLSLVAVLTLGALIIGGIMYITSLGDENRIQRAKNIILYGIIGLVITITSFVIIAVIRVIFVG